MSRFRIIHSRRCGPDASEFDVEFLAGEVNPGEIFLCDDAGAPFEFVIRSVEERAGAIMLSCINWVLSDGHLAGLVAESRPMKAAERKRYRKYLPD